MNQIISRFLNARNHSACIAIGRNFSYRSDLSLDKIYPNSRLQLFTPPPLASINKDGKFSGFIPMDKIQLKYSRSSGPGGQNVNCVDTKVDLRFHVESAEWISQEVREKLLIKYKNQINKEGFFVTKSDVTRYQQLNLADALEKVRNIIRALEKPDTTEPSAESVARATKRREAASRQRLIQKRHKSIIKADRNSSGTLD